MELPQQHRSIINSTDNVDDYSVSDDTDSNKNKTIIKKSTKKKKRKTSDPVAVVGENPIPKLVDNKRRHVERQLSSSQRDKLLFDESKEDGQFKRDIAEAVRESNQTFAQSMLLNQNFCNRNFCL